MPNFPVIVAVLSSAFSARAVLGRGLMFLALLMALCGTVRPVSASDSNWASNFNIPGANGTVHDFVETNDAIFVGGSFTAIGTVAVNRIARYDKATKAWSPLGSGVDNTVNSLAVSDGDLYVGGSFSFVGGTSGRNNIAKWRIGGTDDTAWSGLGSGVGGTVYALAVSGGHLYVGGQFSTAGGTLGRYNIAKWSIGGTTNSSWTALSPSGVGGLSDSVYALAVSGSDLYVGGTFGTAGSTPASRIAKWSIGGTTNSSWSALGSGAYSPGMTGFTSAVTALAVNGSDLYVGGLFNTAGGISANRIAKWNIGGTTDTAWSALGSGVNSPVNTLAVSGSDLYVGGDFTTAGGISANRIAKWNIGGTTDTAWSALGSGVNNTVNTLLVSGGELYMGGNFTMAGEGIAPRIARWDGSRFSGLTSGDGMNNTIRAVVDGGPVVYVAGEFTAAGGVPANRVACWNKTAKVWSALGSGVSSTVNALAVSGSDLYVGGAFTAAGGVSGRNYIAKWSIGGSDDTAWSPLGSGVNGGVNALAVNGSDLYVGGAFNTAGEISVNRIAKWSIGGTTNSSWSALGSGVNNSVNTLVVSGSDLYVGGSFTTAGGASASRIAKWNIGSTTDTAWSGLGSGVDSTVNALAVSRNDLFVGGSFTTAGGTSTSRIAKWSLGGTTNAAWSALGSGVNNTVNALAMSGSDLYVGGAFTRIGTTTTHRPYIAKWNFAGTDDTAWSGLGSGVGGTVNALAVSGSDLYVGGSFARAGLYFSNNIGRYSLPDSNSAPLTASVSLNSSSPKTNDVLTATATASSANGGVLTLTYVWKKGDTVVKTTSNTSSLSDTLNLATPGNGDKDDVIQVEVVASDGTLSSAPASAQATVANSAPQVISQTASATSGAAGEPLTLDVVLEDADGAGDIDAAWLTFNDRLDWTDALTLVYVPDGGASSGVYLRNSAGTAWLGPVAVGSEISNEQGHASLVQTQTTDGDAGVGTRLQLQWQLKPGARMMGANQSFTRVEDSAVDLDAADQAVEFVPGPEYTVLPNASNQAPSSEIIVPQSDASGRIAGQSAVGEWVNVRVRYSDADGAADVSEGWLLFNTVVDWTNAACLLYDASKDQLLLRRDDGTDWLGAGLVTLAESETGAITRQGSGLLSNSKVEVDLAGTRVWREAVGTGGTGMGGSVVVSYRLRFLQPAVGANKVWTRVADASGALDVRAPSNMSGFVPAGSWKVTDAINAPVRRKKSVCPSGHSASLGGEKRDTKTRRWSGPIASRLEENNHATNSRRG